MSTSRTRRNSPKSKDGAQAATASRQPRGAANRARAPVSRPRTQAQQKAVEPSPFTPIADYAFLSDCHTGALFAPDGSIDWLCVPRFDSPSVFGSLLDRGAGTFRLGPFGINVPSGHVYEPGTNTLLTSWKTPSGWATVREALTMGPRRGEDTVTPHTRPPADEDADHMLVRTVTCVEGSVEIELVCEPAFDYGRVPSQWLLSEDRRSAQATGAGQSITLTTDMLIGIEGDTAAREARPQGRRVGLLRALLGRGGTGAQQRPGSSRAAQRHHLVLAPLACAGPYSRTTSSAR